MSLIVVSSIAWIKDACCLGSCDSDGLSGERRDDMYTLADANEVNCENWRRGKTVITESVLEVEEVDECYIGSTFKMKVLLELAFKDNLLQERGLSEVLHQRSTRRHESQPS